MGDLPITRIRQSEDRQAAIRDAVRKEVSSPSFEDVMNVFDYDIGTEGQILIRILLLSYASKAEGKRR